MSEPRKGKPKPPIRELVMKRGIQFASDEDLLTLILGSGTRDNPVEKIAARACKVMETCSGENLLVSLLEIPGLGHSKALCLAAVLEIARRRASGLKLTIRQPADALPLVQKYAEKTQEYFVCIALNGAHEVISSQVVAVGALNRTIIRPRDVFTEALKSNAAAVLLCHNHPSGRCVPSDDDIATTKRLAKAAEILGIAVLDHLIITREKYFSFMANNLLALPNPV